MNGNYYEVTWFVDKDLNNYDFKEFKTKKKALEFYNQHKDDTDKFEFWVTYRDEEGFVLKDIVA